jgi:hypothetical protein
MHGLSLLRIVVISFVRKCPIDNAPNIEFYQPAALYNASSGSCDLPRHDSHRRPATQDQFIESMQIAHKGCQHQFVVVHISVG